MNNYDWAELLLTDAKLPVGLNLCNVLRWMCAENPATYWWRDSNPLNVGDFTGPTQTLASLTEGAVVTAAVLRQSNMSGIFAVLERSGSTAAFSAAAAASPWSARHYYYPLYIANIPVPKVVEVP